MIQYQLSATPEDCAREIEAVRGRRDRAEGPGPIVRDKPPENPARKLRSVSERRINRRDDLSDAREVQYTIKVPSNANRDFWVRLLIGDWDGSHSTLTIEGSDQAVQRTCEPRTHQPLIAVLRAFVWNGWVVGPDVAGATRSRSWASDVMSVLLAKRAREMDAEQRRAERVARKISLPTDDGSRQDFQRMLEGEFGLLRSRRRWYVEPLWRDPDHTSLSEIFFGTFFGTSDNSGFPPVLWSIKTFSDKREIATMRDVEHVHGLVIDFIPSDDTSDAELSALRNSIAERLVFWKMLDRWSTPASVLASMIRPHVAGQVRPPAPLPAPGPTDEVSSTTVSRGEDTSGMQDGTRQKLDRMRRERRGSVKNGKVTLGRMDACEKVEISRETVIKYEPELWANWSDSEYS